MRTSREPGPINEKEVMQYQRTRDLTIDGIVGNETWGQLMIDLKLSAASRGLEQNKYWMIACALLAVALTASLAL